MKAQRSKQEGRWKDPGYHWVDDLPGYYYDTDEECEEHNMNDDLIKMMEGDWDWCGNRPDATESYTTTPTPPFVSEHAAVAAAVRFRLRLGVCDSPKALLNAEIIGIASMSPGLQVPALQQNLLVHYPSLRCSYC